MKQSQRVMPAKYQDTQQAASLALENTIQNQRKTFAREYERFMAEAKFMQEETDRALQESKRDLFLIQCKIGAAKQRLTIADEKVEVRKLELAQLNARMREFESKAIAADAAKEEALLQSERMRIARRELEHALATLRAYPSAKIEGWARRRQSMDPPSLPRLAAPAFCSVWE